MAVADLAGEWFESEPLRATIAAGGVLGSFLGPWSAGSAAVLLLLGAGEGHPDRDAAGSLRGGPGALADALAAAARQAGVEIRTGADVARIDVADERRDAASRSPTGEQIAARAVVSNADPKRTLLGLVDPMHLAPEFVRRVQNIRAHGTLAKVNYAVSRAAATSPGCRRVTPIEQASALSGRIRLAADIDGIERAFDAAKYGGFADEPWIELDDPVDRRSVAGAGRTARRVGLRAVRAVSSARRPRWDAERESLGDAATRTIARYAPGFESVDRRARGDHAARSRAHVRPDRRPHLSRRARARSAAS